MGRRLPDFTGAGLPRSRMRRGGLAQPPAARDPATTRQPHLTVAGDRADQSAAPWRIQPFRDRPPVGRHSCEPRSLGVQDSDALVAPVPETVMVRQHRDARAQVPCFEEPGPGSSCRLRDLQVEGAHPASGVDESSCEADVLVGGPHAASLELDCGADVFSAGGDPVTFASSKHPVHDEGAACQDDNDDQKNPQQVAARMVGSAGAEVEMLRLAHRPSMPSLHPDRSRRIGTLQL